MSDLGQHVRREPLLEQLEHAPSADYQTQNTLDLFGAAGRGFPHDKR